MTRYQISLTVFQSAHAFCCVLIHSFAALHSSLLLLQPVTLSISLNFTPNQSTHFHLHTHLIKMLFKFASLLPLLAVSALASNISVRAPKQDSELTCGEGTADVGRRFLYCTLSLITTQDFNNGVNDGSNDAFNDGQVNFVLRKSTFAHSDILASTTLLPVDERMMSPTAPSSE